MILAILAIAAVVLFIAIAFCSLWYVWTDWEQEYGYRAYNKRIWKAQDDLDDRR